MTPIRLARDELHVWRAWLDPGPERVAALHGLLSADERERAARYRFERDRSRYSVGRGLLRLLLSRYTGRSPTAIRFRYGQFGKPELEGAGPWFNLSHSGPVALFALSSQAEVGVDVEQDHGDFAKERIAERFFSPGEVQALRALPVELQARAFLHCWTRKEAFIKARGDGLSLALDSFDVSLEPGHPAVLRRIAFSGEDPAQWRIQDLSDSKGQFIAAVATRSTGWRAISRPIEEILSGETLSNQEAR